MLNHPIVTDLFSRCDADRRLKDYTGQRFGRLTALGFVERDAKWYNHRWFFRCDCGFEKVLGIRLVRSGHTSSCGCIKREETISRNTTHGLSRTYPSTYRSWKDMRARCRNPHDSNFSDYGGRGISICQRWDDFATFVEDMGERPAGLTLDRIDVNGDYKPGNCRWATGKTQANNKRTNYLITIGNETRTLQQWCDLVGIEPSKVRYRLKVGMTVQAALSKVDYRDGIARPANSEGI